MLHRVYRTLAIDPMHGGFAWVLLEGSQVLVDWGFARPSSEEAFSARLHALFDRYQPDVLVLEHIPDVRCGKRARLRIARAAELADLREIRVYRLSRIAVQREFRATGTKKQAIAVAIARFFPELQPHLPTPRKAWMAEDIRMNLFDAASFALTALSDLESRDHDV